MQLEIHEALVPFQDLVEDEATNQDAWLTESAGALANLHSSVLTSLRDSGSEASADARPAEHPHAIADRCPSDKSSPGVTDRKAEGDNVNTQDQVFDRRLLSAPASPEMHKAKVLPGGGHDRRRLWELGNLLARKRRFAASRQVRGIA